MTDALESIADDETSTRRTVLRGMAVVGAVAGTPMLAAACGDDGDGDSTNTTGTGDDADAGDDTSNENEGSDGGSDDSGSDDSDAAGDDDAGDDDADDSDDNGDDNGDDGDAIAQTSEIDVGGGVIVADEEIIITQPEEGTFVGLTSKCSHRGCDLSDVTDGTINCASACGHGSQFDLSGAVTNGPATEPLAEVALQVDGESITRA